jgi:hypothetical protein
MLALLLVFCSWAEAGQPQQLRLKWEELDSRITDKKVAFVLPDGTRVEGKVVVVLRDGLRLKVSKSSNRKTQPKGEQTVSRQALSVLRVTQYGKMGRLLFTTGAVATAAGIVLAQSIDLYEGPAVYVVPAVIAGGIAGVAVAGYYVGRAFDKKVFEIQIIPGTQ